MNPISWFLVFVFRVFCTLPIAFIAGVAIMSLINMFIFENSMEIYGMLIFAFIVSLVTSISMVLQDDF